MAKAATLIDTCASKDTAKWTFGAGVTVASGQLSFDTNSGYTATMVSLVNYDLTGSYFRVELVQRPSQGTGTTTFYLEAQVDAANLEQILITDTQLYWGEKVAAVDSQTTTVYSAVTHRWIGIRESGGTVFWEASPDNVTWNTLRSKAAGITLTNVTLQFRNGYYGTETTPAPAIIDNVNVTSGNPTQFFPFF